MGKADTQSRRQQRDLPIDRGWAWVVLIACTVEFFILVGFFKSFGLFFVEFIRKYDSSSSSISLVLSIQTLFFSLFSVFVLGLGTSYFSTRTLVMSGALILATSQICNAFAPSDSFLVFSQGFLFGTGAAIMHGPATLMLSFYFEKRRGLSNSVANVGGSIGGLVWPPLVTLILDWYGLQGCFFLVSGMFLNAVVCGALMRPLDISQIREGTEQGAELTVVESSNGVKSQQTPEVHSHILSRPLLSKHNSETKEENGKQSATYLSYEKLHFTPRIQYGRRRTVSETVTDSYSPETNRAQSLAERKLERNIQLYGSFGDAIGSFPSGNIFHSSKSVNEISHSHEISNDFHNSACNDCCSKIFDLSLLKKPLFVLFMFVAFFAVPGCALPVSYIPPFAKDFGIPDKDIALMVTISALCDLVSRTTLAFISDTKRIKRHVIVAICLLANGTACMFSSFYTSYSTLMIYAVAYGIFGGVYFTLYPVVIVDFVGVESLKYGLAMITVISGVSISIFSLLIGTIRDTTNSYMGGVYLYGSCVICAAVGLLVFEPICRRIQQKRDLNGPN